MGKAKQTRKFAAVKRMIKPSDPRLKDNVDKAAKKALKDKLAEEKKAAAQTQVSSSLFLSHNTDLGPPYRVLVDTNFINFSIQNKIELVQGMMDCLMAKCIPTISDCVLAELEKLGPRYRLALKIAKDPRFERLKCDHKGTYADDCMVQRVSQSRCYIVATCDRDLRRRIRKVPGVPLMYVVKHKYQIERLPDGGAAFI